MALSISPNHFSALETAALMRAGFLTSSVQGLSSANVFAGPCAGLSGSLISISNISKAGSGTMAAIGGEDAIYDAGGRSGIRRSSSQLEKSSEQISLGNFGEGLELKLSLPSTGAYLKVRLVSVKYRLNPKFLRLSLEQVTCVRTLFCLQLAFNVT